MLSRKAHRPVKMVMTRDEVFRATGPTSGSQMRMKLGAKRDGTLVAADVPHLVRGRRVSADRRSGAGAMCVLAPYKIPNFLIEALRRRRQQAQGRGVPRAGLADGARSRPRSLVDEIARELGIDPIELRLQERGRGGRPRAVRPDATGRSACKETLEAAQEPPALQGAARPEPGARRRLRLLVQRRHEVERHRQRSTRDGTRGRAHRQSRHRRHARVAGADGGRGARHPGRARAPGGRRHRQRRLHRPDRRQPRLLSRPAWP